MDVFSYVVGVLVLIPVLLRQIRAVPVPRAYVPRLPIVLGVIGLFAMSSYAGDHHVTSGDWTWVVGTLVGAAVLGGARGASMRVWDTNGWVVRQANIVTMALWLITLVLQFAGDAVTGLVGASFLIFLGLTMAAQRYVEFRRARPLWARLGPDAGRPLIMNFTQGPGAFFATFRTDAQGAGGPAGRGGTSAQYDPNIIDVEVVDDDEEHGPPELHAPH
ncbi:MAG TPA: hypothetical protein VK773_04180 [Acidimicrobiales bacterium]|jgi:hypothetical protein|nr:hypothetical protein [Acidimicrobiales bacterium]